MKKSWLILIIFNLAYVICFAQYYLSIQNYEFMLYIGVVLIIGTIITLTLKQSKLDLVALWGLSIWGLMHMIGGGVKIGGETVYSLHLFEIINKGGEFYVLKMDQLIHFYGFAVAALVLYQLLAPRLNSKVSNGFIIFIAWVGSMGLGALNEVVEFIAFVSLSQTGVGGVYNTGLDLVFNMFGALFGAWVASKLKYR